MDRPGAATRQHGRDDSWTDAATGALIEAWGSRYLRLDRGILRQKDWKEIADAVNADDNGGGERDGKKSPRIKTDAQCKNRVDTLKKKYKLERSKPSPSSWPFFRRLDFLLGDSAVANSGGEGDGNGNKKKRHRSTVAPAVKPVNAGPGPPPRAPEIRDDGDRDGGAAGELARALARLAEVYERVERSKQRTAMELERQRMEFSKEIEFQRINMFMDAQLEMEKKSKSKSRNRGTKMGSGSGKK